MEKPIRVCFIIDSLSRAGTEMQLLMLLKHLDRTRIEPFPVLLDGTSELSCSLELPGIAYERLAVKKLISFDGLKKGLKFRAFLRKHRIDLIQAYYPHSTFFASIVGKLSGVKLVFGARRNIGHWMKPRDKRRARFLNRFFIDKIIANAEACKLAAIEQENAKPENVIVIPNGIETELYDVIPTWIPEAANTPLRIGAVGNIKPVKGTDILIDAAKIVLQKFPDVRFEIVGDGDFDAYNKQIVDRGIAGNFKLLGSQSDIPGFLSTLDIAVLPSRAEGLSNGLLEYMAAGRPCIATDVGGNGELIKNGKNGLLVPSENPQALADAIIELLENPEKAANLAKNARNDIKEKFDADLIASRFCDLCEKMLKGK